MSKKDYQAIAAILHRNRTQETDHGSESRSVVSMIAQDLADMMAGENPRFDRERFIEACETGTCRGMRKVA
jgi:hypothetical protein